MSGIAFGSSAANAITCTCYDDDTIAKQIFWGLVVVHCLSLF
jgi:hypothetical protein